jgi:hypothetical protein
MPEQSELSAELLRFIGKRGLRQQDLVEAERCPARREPGRGFAVGETWRRYGKRHLKF